MMNTAPGPVFGNDGAGVVATGCDAVRIVVGASCGGVGVGVGVGVVGVGVGVGVGFGTGVGDGFGTGTGMPLTALAQLPKIANLNCPLLLKATNAGIELDKNPTLVGRK